MSIVNSSGPCKFVPLIVIILLFSSFFIIMSIVHLGHIDPYRWEGIFRIRYILHPRILENKGWLFLQFPIALLISSFPYNLYFCCKDKHKSWFLQRFYVILYFYVYLSMIACIIPPKFFIEPYTLWMVASRATCPFGSGDIVISLWAGKNLSMSL